MRCDADEGSLRRPCAAGPGAPNRLAEDLCRRARRAVGSSVEHSHIAAPPLPCPVATLLCPLLLLFFLALRSLPPIYPPSPSRVCHLSCVRASRASVRDPLGGDEPETGSDTQFPSAMLSATDSGPRPDANPVITPTSRGSDVRDRPRDMGVPEHGHGNRRRLFHPARIRTRVDVPRTCLADQRMVSPELRPGLVRRSLVLRRPVEPIDPR